MAHSLTTAIQHLLDFARTDWERIKNKKQVKKARRTIAVIAAQAGHYSQQKRLVLSNRKAWLSEIEKDLPLTINTYRPLRSLHTELNEHLAHLYPVGGFGDLPGGSTEVEVRVSILNLQRHNYGESSPVEVGFVADSWQDAFWLSVTALLEEFGSKLRRCPECQVVYLRTGRQSYCSPPCERKARNARYYKRTRKLGRRKR